MSFVNLHCNVSIYRIEMMTVVSVTLLILHAKSSDVVYIVVEDFVIILSSFGKYFSILLIQGVSIPNNPFRSVNRHTCLLS